MKPEPIVEQPAEPEPGQWRQWTLHGDGTESWVMREPAADPAAEETRKEPREAAERGEPISDVKPPPNFEPDPLDVPLRGLESDETKAVQ